MAKLPESRTKNRVRLQEHRKASIRAKVEHPFRVIKSQFGLMEVRFRGLAKTPRTWSRCLRCRTCGWRESS